MREDERVTAYIARAAPFAQPILEHVRALVHRAVPGTTETLKWSMPFFGHAGKPLAMMAAFKAHAGVGIFDGVPMGSGVGLGNVGRLTRLSDLPCEEQLIERLLAAQARIAAGDGGMKRTPVSAMDKPSVGMPDDLAAALNAMPAAREAFAAFPPGAQREYRAWVADAKQPATRARRIATAVAQCREGKRLNWKYERC